MRSYISDTQDTLNRGNKTYNDNVDSKQGNDHAKHERYRFQAAYVKGLFFKRGKINYLPWTSAKNKNSGVFVIHDLLDIIKNHIKFYLNRIRT